MNTKFKLLPILALTVAAGLTPQVKAATSPFSISAPDFLIPWGGQNGTLTLFSDGRAPETSGFNVLGIQKLTIAGNSVSSGTLTLNLHFPSLASFDSLSEVQSAMLRLTVRDFDFLGDQISTGVSLRETAVLSAINGSPLTAPIELGNLLPAGTTVTDNKILTLNPIVLTGSALPVNSTEPFILSFTLTATITSHSSRSLTLYNAPERITSDITLALAPTTVPEPSTLALIGLGSFLVLTRIMRRR